MWPFKKRAKIEICLTDEENEAVDKGWKLFVSALPKKEESGEWYAPKESIKTMRNIMASQSLMDLAERYLREGSLSDKTNQNVLFEKAVTAALKAVTIDADLFNLYKAGKILERANKTDQAKIFFRDFLTAAPILLKESKEFGSARGELIQQAIDDVKFKLKRKYTGL